MTQDLLLFHDIKKLQVIAAKVVAQYGHAYLPIFKRIHSEVEKYSNEEELKAIALNIALS